MPRPPEEQQIVVAEERLRRAMLDGDVATLEALIAPELIFTNHLGQVFGKQDDLALHRSGALKFITLAPSEERRQIGAGQAIVSVRMALSGSYDGQPFAADLRYTRVWRRAGGGHWQIVAGHSSAVA